MTRNLARFHRQKSRIYLNTKKSENEVMGTTLSAAGSLKRAAWPDATADQGKRGVDKKSNAKRTGEKKENYIRCSRWEKRDPIKSRQFDWQRGGELGRTRAHRRWGKPLSAHKVQADMKDRELSRKKNIEKAGEKKGQILPGVPIVNTGNMPPGSRINGGGFDP